MPFIKVKLANDVTLSYKIPDTDGLKLESGKKYKYNITVDMSGLSISSTIADWEAVNTKTGTAEME